MELYRRVPLKKVKFFNGILKDTLFRKIERHFMQQTLFFAYCNVHQIDIVILINI